MGRQTEPPDNVLLYSRLRETTASWRWFPATWGVVLSGNVVLLQMKNVTGSGLRPWSTATTGEDTQLSCTCPAENSLVLTVWEGRHIKMTW